MADEDEGDDHEEVLGIAYAKDLMRAVRSGQGTAPLGSLVRPVSVVPENKPVAKLMRDMQRELAGLATAVAQIQQSVRTGGGRAHGCGRPPGRRERDCLAASSRHEGRHRPPLPPRAEERHLARARRIPARVAQDRACVFMAGPFIEPPKRFSGPEFVKGDRRVVALFVCRLPVTVFLQQDAQKRGVGVELDRGFAGDLNGGLAGGAHDDRGIRRWGGSRPRTGIVFELDRDEHELVAAPRDRPDESRLTGVVTEIGRAHV